jgi:hypothetical protein
MSELTEAITIQLPLAALRRLRRVAEIAQRPVDKVIAETLQSSLPPLLEDVPAVFREKLAELELLSNEELWQQVHAKFDPASGARYDALLAANAAGSLAPQEQEELRQLRADADLLMFRKAYAAVLLKWRGEHVPTLAELT